MDTLVAEARLAAASKFHIANLGDEDEGEFRDRIEAVFDALEIEVDEDALRMRRGRELSALSAIGEVG